MIIDYEAGLEPLWMDFNHVSDLKNAKARKNAARVTG